MVVGSGSGTAGGELKCEVEEWMLKSFIGGFRIPSCGGARKEIEEVARGDFCGVFSPVKNFWRALATFGDPMV